MFNFDYKTDLNNHARLRERVFTLSQFAPQFDEEGNLLNDSKLDYSNIPVTDRSSNKFDSGRYTGPVNGTTANATAGLNSS